MRFLRGLSISEPMINIKLFDIHSLLRWRLLIVTAVACATAVLLQPYRPTDAQAGANCSSPYLVDEILANGARWQLCWEQRNLDGIVLRSVYFTPPGGTQQRILAQGSISQVHVPYDDNSARFHDITDDGFGNENLNDLTPEECPGGTLLKDGTKDALCRQIKPRGHAFKGLGAQGQGELLSLFSVSTSGEYNYIPVWRFFDDGTIELMMGATGKLQRFTENGQFGWPVRASGTRGTSHIHNYYWRLDFDLGESGDNDIVEEFNYTINNSTGATGQRRTLGISRFTTETGRSIAPETLRSWRIRDGLLANADGRAISYHLEPVEMGHRDMGPTSEPWTANDFYVTKYNACEKYVSHNPQTAGCGNHLGAFVNGESLVNTDVVLWYGVTFHHVPRDEDEVYMHTHWDGFRLVPRDWMAANPSAADVVTCAVGDVNCDEQQDATDSLFMLQHDVRLRTGSKQIPPPSGTLYEYSCDVSGEGICNAVDALLALQCTVGLANHFCPSSTGLPVAQAATLTAQPVRLHAGEVVASEKEGNYVLLRLNTPSLIGALSLEVAYDPALLKDVTCTTAAENQGGNQQGTVWDTELCHVDEAAGVVRFAAVAVAGVSDDALEIGALHFAWRATSDAALPFSISGLSVTDQMAIAIPTTIQMDALGEQLYLPLILRLISQSHYGNP